MDKEYVIYSLCGDKPKFVTKKELMEMHEANPYLFGFHGSEIVANATNPNYDDWTELVFLVEENVVMPKNLSAETIYNFIASWCCNVAFGNMDNYDAKMSVRDFADYIEEFDEQKAREYREIANKDYFYGQFSQLSWDSFMNTELVSEDELPKDVDLSDPEAVERAIDEINAQVEDYNIDEYLRELNPPFGYDRTEVKNLLADVLGGDLSMERCWSSR